MVVVVGEKEEDLLADDGEFLGFRAESGEGAAAMSWTAAEEGENDPAGGLWRVAGVIGAKSVSARPRGDTKEEEEEAAERGGDGSEEMR